VPDGELFRAEAVAEQQDRWLGRVLLAPRLPWTLLTLVALAVASGVIGLILLGEYTRKSRMTGLLAPEQGLIEVVATQAGVVTRLSAVEGMEVEAGTPLAVLSAERRTEALGATQDAVVRQLAAQRESLRSELDRHLAIFAGEAAVLERRVAATAAEEAALAREVALLGERRDLADRALIRQRELRDRGIAIEEDLREAEADALDQALALQTLERSRATLMRTRLDLEAEQAALPLREAMQLAETERATAALELALAEAEAAREIVVVAPEAGTITAVRAASGSTVGPDAPLLTLVPAGARLEARLYGPSSAIGFVRPGQAVRLRYEAFPHQKFGQYAGVVRNVSLTTVGATEPAARATPGQTAGEPLYRVTVDLDAQTARAYGAAVALQPGMQLEADVLIETRPIWRWVLDPLYSLSGRDAA